MQGGMQGGGWVRCGREGGRKNKQQQQPQQHLGYEVITALCTRNNRLAPPRPQMFPPVHRPKPTNQTPKWRPNWGPRCRPSPHPSSPPFTLQPSLSGSWRRSPAFSHPATKETEWAWTASCAVGLSDRRVCEPPDLHICGASGRDSGRRFANYSLIPSPLICTESLHFASVVVAVYRPHGAKLMETTGKEQPGKK